MDDLTPRGERQRETVLSLWDALQTALAAWGAYQLLAQLLKRNRK
jgi:hypothetical protein